MKFFDLSLKKSLYFWKESVYFCVGFSFLIVLSQGLFRLLMYSLFKGSEPAIQWNHYVLNSFVLGMRFDYAVANYILIFPCLLGILCILLRNSSVWAIHARIQFWFLSASLLLVSFLALCNLTFYSYFKDHFNLMTFGLIEDDTLALIKGLWINEPILWEILGISIFSFILVKLLKLIKIRAMILAKSTFFPLFSFPIWVLLWIVVVGLGARGSLKFNMHPLNRIHTEVSPYYFLNQLSFSPIYALKDAFVIKRNIQSSNFDLIKEMGYENNIAQAIVDFKLEFKPAAVRASSLDFAKKVSSKKEKRNLPHIVVFAMESMGSFWLSFDSPEFPILGAMKTHFDSDAVNWNFLPSGNGTFPSVTHWLLNMAELPGVAAAEKYIDRDFLTSAITPFKKAGYKTHYVYGGGLGWRNLSGFLYRLGFDELHGETRIKDSLKDVGETHDWGLFDGDLFRYVEKILAEATEPQFLFVLSTTNHPPFSVPSHFEKPNFAYPKKLSSRFTQTSDTLLSRLTAYRYSMDSLGQFMNHVKTNPWGSNIVVTASGDHSFYESVQFSPENFIEWKGVPFYMYSSIPFPKKVFQENFGAHQDIFPTIYELTLSEVEYIAMGRSLLKPSLEPAVTSGALIDSRFLLLGERLFKKEDGFEKYKVIRETSGIEETMYKKRLNAYRAIAADLILKSPKIKAKK